MLRLHSPASSEASAPPRHLVRQVPKKRGNYNCGRCGMPKKGHVCVSGAAAPPRSRRSLSYEVDPAGAGATGGDRWQEDAGEDWFEVGGGGGVLPAACLVEVLRRLPPKELTVAAGVCRGWRDCVRKAWRSTDELRLRVFSRSHVGNVNSLLSKCSALTKLTLRMESDFDAAVLACVGFSCPGLEVFKISCSDGSVNRMTGYELGRFVTDHRCLSSLDIEGCINLGSLTLFSSSLTKLWLSDLYCLSKMAINCPNMKELSLEFAQQEDDSSDLVSIMECVGRACPKLRNLHVASLNLCNDAILALTNANLRFLRMLSLVLGSRITDASVAAIVSCCTSLELLDMSGSKISDNGIGMICNAFPQTLSKLLLALCSNITSSGIQFATAQLPYLQVLDCGMSLCDQNYYGLKFDNIWMQNIDGCDELPQYQIKANQIDHSIYQKLIIKHGHLKKLSLWGCSGLDALHLNCPELLDLNLNSCVNLHPERLLLQCPNLESIHAFACPDMMIRAINSQIFEQARKMSERPPCKRLADASKRIQAPSFLHGKPINCMTGKRPRTQISVHL